MGGVCVFVQFFGFEKILKEQNYKREIDQSAMIDINICV